MATDYMTNHDWVLVNRYGEEKRVMEDIARAIYSMDPMNRRIEDMLTVVSELCLNAFEHGNRMRTNTRVYVSMAICENDYRFCVYDEGEGFEYIPPAKNAMIHLDNEQTRGWGLYLINSLSDQVLTGFSDHLFYVEVQFRRMGGMKCARK